MKINELVARLEKGLFPYDASKPLSMSFNAGLRSAIDVLNGLEEMEITSSGIEVSDAQIWAVWSENWKIHNGAEIFASKPSFFINSFARAMVNDVFAVAGLGAPNKDTTRLDWCEADSNCKDMGTYFEVRTGPGTGDLRKRIDEQMARDAAPHESTKDSRRLQWLAHNGFVVKVTKKGMYWIARINTDSSDKLFYTHVDGASPYHADYMFAIDSAMYAQER